MLFGRETPDVSSGCDDEFQFAVQVTLHEPHDDVGSAHAQFGAVTEVRGPQVLPTKKLHPGLVGFQDGDVIACLSTDVTLPVDHHF